MPSDCPLLPFLSEKALDRLEESAYRLLGEVGISLQHAATTQMHHGLGCRDEKGRVLIPRDAVAWALENVTPHRTFYNLDGSEAFKLDERQLSQWGRLALFSTIWTQASAAHHSWATSRWLPACWTPCPTLEQGRRDEPKKICHAIMMIGLDKVSHLWYSTFGLVHSE